MTNAVLLGFVRKPVFQDEAGIPATLPGGGNATDDPKAITLKTYAAASALDSEACTFVPVDPPPFHVRTMQRKLDIAMAALRDYRAAEDAAERFLAGFAATPDMRAKNSVAALAIDLIETIA